MSVLRKESGVMVVHGSGFGQLSEFPLVENNAMSYLGLRFTDYSRQDEQDLLRDAEGYFAMPLDDMIYSYDRIRSYTLDHHKSDFYIDSAGATSYRLTKSH